MSSPTASFLAFLLRSLIDLLGLTYRYEIIQGEEQLRGIQTNEDPRIVTLWHNRIIPGLTFLVENLVRRGGRIVTLASLSGDGELVSRIIEGWKVTVIRGSSSRGGAKAYRQLYTRVRREGASIVMTPDGPRGPLYDFKAGAAALAQATQVPILPIGFAARRFSSLRSWDRFIVPWPFTKIAVAIGTPFPIARDQTPEELEAVRLQIQTIQSDLTRQAEAWLGVDDLAAPTPPPEAAQ